jgi:hypothetical protein
MIRKSIAAMLAAVTIATAGVGLSTGTAAADSFSFSVGIGTPDPIQVGGGRWDRGWEGRGGWDRDDDRGRWDRDRRGGRHHGRGWGRRSVQVCQPVYTQQPIWRNGYFYGYQTVQTTQCTWNR